MGNMTKAERIWHEAFPDRPRPAEVFPPCALLREELEHRGKGPVWLARQAGLPVEVSRCIVAGVIPMTPDVAEYMARAFGTSVQSWVNLQAAWDAWWPGELPGAKDETT